MDEAGVRAVIARLTQTDGSPVVVDAEIDNIVIDEGWLAVVLGPEDVARERLSLLHDHLKAVYPDVEIEIRSGGRVFPGGYGLGAKRPVIPVLGGKGGAGKSTVAVNLGPTLAALGFRVGTLGGDLDGPVIP